MGFIYNDITSSDMGLKARLTLWQVSGKLRNFTASVPGKYGVSDFGADYDYREIKVSCSIFPKINFASLVSTLDAIALWLDPLSGLKQLIFDEVPDRYFMARLAGEVDCERLLKSSGRFELSFFCPDPFAYAITDEEFTVSGEGASTVKRTKGNMESNPVYRLKGVMTAGEGNFITVTTNEEEIKVVNAALSETERLVIDSEKMTAFVEDANGNIIRNGLPYLENLNFPHLKAGDNEVHISAENAVFTSLEIEAKSRWR